MTARERADWIKEFCLIPTGNISDAMDALTLSRGAVLGLRPLIQNQRRAVGFALTILQTRRQKPADGVNLARHGEVIDRQAAPGDLLVIDMRAITEVSAGGSIQLMLAQARGATGYLTNGCVRDAAEIAAMGFPVYCAGTSPVKSAVDIETVGVNVPVYLGGVTIHPGDLVVMDDTGVMVIPQQHIFAVCKEAKAIQKREEQMVALLRQGMSLVEARRQLSEKKG